MPPRIHLSDVKDLIGKEIGISKWITVDQTMIDRFAEATDDHQFIHTDPARAAAETPFGGTIAHGFLSLSLLSAMNFDCLPRVIEQTMGINYGFDKVRFMTPVKSGAKVRGRFTMAEARFRGAGPRGWPGLRSRLPLRCSRSGSRCDRRDCLRRSPRCASPHGRPCPSA